MPAYNAARTIEKTHGDLPKHLVDKVIVVDDASDDNTPEIARRLGLECVVHVQNRGYGGNQKTCYLESLRDGADIVVMVHPDNQYDASRLPAIVDPIASGRADMVMGSRLMDGRAAALRGGMPAWKYVANRFLTLVENWVFRIRLSEAHTGFRAYSRELLMTIPFLLNSDDFVFDTEIIAQALAFGFSISEVSVPTRYFPEASSTTFKQSVKYGLATLNVVRKYALHTAHIRRYRLFDQRLAQVVSREYHPMLFGPTNVADNDCARDG
jgi:glycosyltransferase involved in cell wall biosynthesis